MNNPIDKKTGLPIALEARLYFFLGGGRRWFYEVYPKWRDHWGQRLNSRLHDPRAFIRLLSDAITTAEGSASDSPRVRLQKLHQEMLRIIRRRLPQTGMDCLVVAVEELIKERFWYPGPMGRLLPRDSGWGLLWPLAAKDLGRRTEIPMEELVRLLTGELTPALEDWRRKDGRLLKALVPKPEIQALVHRVF
jgi:hypothetical protein